MCPWSGRGCEGWSWLLCNHTGVGEKKEDEGNSERSCHGLTTAFKSSLLQTQAFQSYFSPLCPLRRERSWVVWQPNKVNSPQDRCPGNTFRHLGCMIMQLDFLFYYCASGVSNYPNDMGIICIWSWLFEGKRGASVWNLAEIITTYVKMLIHKFFQIQWITL